MPILSAIWEGKIVRLDFLPPETSVPMENGAFTAYRPDFPVCAPDRSSGNLNRNFMPDKTPSHSG
uniref:Uncharacterized protein n=1 Tax=Candidatus Kentrum sp. TUN TaxID=2126343 RepID=A0A451A2J8_9GAMM|nr:MAG: hypothetical protein BECKTUN1418D_GA0071000_11192 [Candidatus Kentron sp. TUN]